MSFPNKQPDSVSNVSAGVAQLTIDTTMSDDTMSDAVPSSDAITPTASTHDAIEPPATEPLVASPAGANTPTKTEPELTDAELRRLTMFLLCKLDQKLGDLYYLWHWTDAFKDIDHRVIEPIYNLQCWAHQLRDLIVEQDPELKLDTHYWDDHRFRYCGSTCRRKSIRNAAAKKPRKSSKQAQEQA